MTFTTAITLFFSMVVLALIPGPAILLVVTRSTTAGFRHGAYTVMGIVAGDFAYITLALLGLAALAEQLGDFFVLFQYAGALYLIVLGLSLLRTQAVVDEPVALSVSNRGMSFLLGFLTTIGNPKAILFYLSFLPAFINLDAVSLKDAVVLYVAATLAVGSVLLGYAYTASRLRASAQQRIHTGKEEGWVIASIPVKALIRYVSCIMLVASGVYIAAVAQADEPLGSTTQALNDQATFSSRLVKAALARTQYNVRYDGAYIAIDYPNGDVPSEIGVCTDVVIRAYRALGIDLQKTVHEDMAQAFEQYPSRRIWGLTTTDKNIDHRRVPNLQRFFARHGLSLPVTQQADDYLPGDIVSWTLPGNLPHIGIVTDDISGKTGSPKIVHNIGAGPKLDDMLFDYPITGHYRYMPLVPVVPSN